MDALGLTLDMIASAIIGAVERDRLESTIGEFEKTLEGFVPASWEFIRNLHLVNAWIEIALED